MLKNLYFSFISLSCIVLFGFGCNANTGNTDIMQSGSTCNIATSRTKDDWVTYTNSQFGISIDIPRSWKIAEYRGSDGIDTIVAVSFDPEHVGTQVEYDTLDKAMGLVTINVDRKVQSSEFYKVNKVTIGKNKIPADLLIQLCKEPECPNPWWVNRVAVDYYVDLPEDKKTERFDSIRISFQYPEGDEAEESFRVTLEDIVASFAFVNSQ